MSVYKLPFRPPRYPNFFFTIIITHFNYIYFNNLNPTHSHNFSCATAATSSQLLQSLYQRSGIPVRSYHRNQHENLTDAEYPRSIPSKRSVNYHRPLHSFKMCKIYQVTFSCGHTEPQEIPCAESPNTFGSCAGGAKEYPKEYPGPCDKCA
ncbi:hypothetical protein F5Y02DRAFT_275689 [Annulohypoxylon stygium]|nr:hypothetical protein F5Y02DRAFT_275689 [Annulohypoxylon stygium]